MTELEKVEYTKSFIDKLAEGVNPLTDEQIPDGDLLNNVRISRCMFYVSGILDGVISQMKNPKPLKKIRNADKKPFCIGDGDMGKYTYSDNLCTVGDIANQLNSFIDLNIMQRIKVKTIYDWLVSKEYLYNVDGSEKVYRRSAEKGRAAGFTDSQRVSAKGLSYTVILCNKNAQKIIVENANLIAQSDSAQNGEHSGTAWTEEQDKNLTDMFNNGLTSAAMAKETGRTPTAVKARLVRLGLIKNRSDII
ncbi:MAG: hypothetical protein LUF82_03335 [Clostridia bacterium]|nr:hypothetical protein [Clostridia bacterium]